jgi:hypothetical protein
MADLADGERVERCRKRVGDLGRDLDAAASEADDDGAASKPAPAELGPEQTTRVEAVVEDRAARRSRLRRGMRRCDPGQRRASVRRLTVASPLAG